MPEIRIGTSGFSYDDWKGRFYPRDLKRGEMLAYYSGIFSTVEINSTYYGIPRPLVMYQMSRKVPEGFEFAVKAHREMTHGEGLRPAVFAQFREAVAPLRDEEQLSCVLAQFPWSFRPEPENRDYLRELRDQLEGMPVVVEFRNAAWIQEETFDLLRRLDLGFCCVDEPRLDGLVPPVVETTSNLGYVRFHGRNGEKWWHHQEAWERYDYLYSQDELREWIPRVQLVAARTEKTLVYFNNHYEGQAGQNARMMAELLGVALSGSVHRQLDLGL